jgi:hypothetical protein
MVNLGDLETKFSLFSFILYEKALPSAGKALSWKALSSLTDY